MAPCRATQADSLQIRLQLQSHSLSDPLSHHDLKGPTYTGVLPTLKRILRDEGLTALWKGNIPAEALYVTYSATQFLTYRTTNRIITSPPFVNPHTNEPYIPSLARSFITGGLAGSTATTLAYPLDLLRTRFAAQGNHKIYSSLWGSVRDIRRLEGWRGFFRGLLAANIAIVPYMGTFFSSYEVGVHLIKEKS
jgi:solute carrier family 25 thiamine pyrophosphate transporter 19